jgi:hypothetical protein
MPVVVVMSTSPRRWSAATSARCTGPESDRLLQAGDAVGGGGHRGGGGAGDSSGRSISCAPASGPIAISIPNDFLTARFDAEPGGGGRSRRPCHVDAISEAVRLLSERPGRFDRGGGVIAAEAQAGSRASRADSAPP